VVEARGLTTRDGGSTAVDDLTFTVRPGVVTGFLGPNGAGKTTTLPIILGLDTPTSAQALLRALPYLPLRAPIRVVGALLDPAALSGPDPPSEPGHADTSPEQSASSVCYDGRQSIERTRP